MKRSAVDVLIQKKAPGVTPAWVKRVVSGTLALEKAGPRRVGVLVTDDRRIRAINKRHLKHDYATDVISFNLGDERAWGDLVVSVDTARRAAKDLGLPFREELARYLVHGTLHLLGWDDGTPRERKSMHARQEKRLAAVLGRKR